MRRLLRVLGWTTVTLIGLVLIAVALTPRISRAYVRKSLLPRLSERLGRDIAVEEAHLSLLPRPAVVAHKLVIQGKDGRPPLAEIEAVHGHVAAWKAIRSLGKDLEVLDLEITRPRIALARKDLPAFRTSSGGGNEKEGGTLEIAHLRIRGGSLALTELGEEPVTQLDAEAHGLRSGEPISFNVRAAVFSDAQNASGEITRGTHGELQAKISVIDVPLVSAGAILPGGVADALSSGLVSWKGELTTDPNGKYVFDGDARLQDVRARGLGPLLGNTHVTASLDPPNQNAVELRLSPLFLAGQHGELRGELVVQSTPARAMLRAQVRSLNVAGILANVEEGSGSAKGPSASARETIRSVGVKLDVEIGRLVFPLVQAREVHVVGTLRRGVLRMRRLTASFAGGAIDGSGSSLDLSQRTPRLHIHVKGTNLDASEATTAVTGRSQVTGRLSSEVSLTATGATYSAVRQSLRGTGTFKLVDWMVEKRPLLSAFGNVVKNPMTGTFTVQGGAIHLTKPTPLVVPLRPQFIPRVQARPSPSP